MIKTILLDIDGTLTNDKKVITPKTKEALLAAQEKGVRLALASGRPDMGLFKWAKELERKRGRALLPESLKRRGKGGAYAFETIRHHADHCPW